MCIRGGRTRDQGLLPLCISYLTADGTKGLTLYPKAFDFHVTALTSEALWSA